MLESIPMKSVLVILFSAAALSVTANTGAPKYHYTVDLANIVEDRVYVELVTPEMKKQTVKFYLPKVVPGTYAIYDFGRFITNFRAEDAAGNLLPAERGDINTFVIHNAKSLHKISYWVDDTFDDTNGVHVHGMSGTNIEEGRGAVLNGHGFFGYFEGMKDAPFQVTLKKKPGYFGATAMPATYPDDRTEIYQAKNYHYLVDMPILVSKPDTTTIRVGDADVLIAVNSPSGNMTSDFLAEHFADVLEAERKYMGGELPVAKYAFLMHLLTPGQQVGLGALEHNYSSLYVLPDVPQEQFIQPIKDIAAHEFFHIITPLNVHSEQIRYFDFNDPEMSRHLWMYEGVTEYFSHHAQYVHGVTEFQYFLEQMEQKITSSLNHYDDDLPFTELSQECLLEHHDEYGNVYDKGALIGLCLDIILRKESGGESGLMDLMLALMEEYGHESHFKDRKLFAKIKELSHPSAKKFLKKHVAGKAPLPLKETFAAIGVEYSAPGTVRQFTYGNISLDYKSESNRMVIVATDEMNVFGHKMGYQTGDEIISINGKTFDPGQPLALLHGEKEKFKEGQTLTIEVLRQEAGGAGRTVVLSAPIEKIEVRGEASLKAMSDLTPEQKAFRDHWTKGARSSLRS